MSNKMSSNLDKLLDRVEALELAGESASALSTPSINRISEHQQSKTNKKIGKGVVPTSHPPLVPMIILKVLFLDVVRRVTKTPLWTVELCVQHSSSHVTSVG